MTTAFATDTSQSNQQAQQRGTFLCRQKKSAVDFWDEYHAKEEERQGKEWIVNPDALLDLIASHVVPPVCTATKARRSTLRILEIGCGTSALSRSLISHLLQLNNQSLLSSHVNIKIVATDVSKTCIQQNRARDDNFIESLGDNDELRYDVMDILRHGYTRIGINAATTSTPADCMYDVILDKGTLDTFLFRNARGKRSTERHPPLLVSLLCNVHSLLREGGKYIIISPRSRIPSLRQFVGCASVERIKMDVALGVLDGNMQQRNEDNESSAANAYIYICVKGDSAIQLNSTSSASLFRDTHDISSVNDDSKCSGCDLTFGQFRGEESVTGRGEVFWKRKWKGHQVHCTEKRSNSK